MEQFLPILAQINLNGNCYIITLTAVLFILINGVGATWFDIIVVGLVVFFLSLGAPNQPGSILIGLLIIFMYLDAMDFVALAIVSEAMFRRILSVTNAAGDIVTVSIVEKREETTDKKTGQTETANSDIE